MPDPGVNAHRAHRTTSEGVTLASNISPSDVVRIKPARRLPSWLRKSLAPGQEAHSTDALIRDLGLHTICESGNCPNKNECWSQKTATFMILGDKCTRNCGYCSVDLGKPLPPDPQEPQKLADAVGRLGLQHVVVTSVTRDDLDDEGAAHFGEVVHELKRRRPDCIIETLTPDFRRDQARAMRVFENLPIDIFNHNIETVRRLHKKARPQGGYDLSLGLLRAASLSGRHWIVKSGIMTGLGETKDEVVEAFGDLKAAGVQMVTVGQYLKSFAAGLDVERFVTPEEFETYKQIGAEMGFLLVESGPFVRSSYHAKDSFEKIRRHLGKAPLK